VGGKKDGMVGAMGRKETVDADDGWRCRLEQLLVPRWQQALWPFHVPVDLDSKRKAGPLERMKMIVRPVHIVVALWRPLFSLLQLEASRQQRRLCLFRVTRHEVEVRKTARGARVARC
jgi:hypothetical protein